MPEMGSVEQQEFIPQFWRWSTPRSASQSGSFCLEDGQLLATSSQSFLARALIPACGPHLYPLQVLSPNMRGEVFNL